MTKNSNNEGLWDLTKGQRLVYGIAILSMWLSTLFLFAVPLVSRLAIDGVLNEDHSLTGWGLLSATADVFASNSKASQLWTAAGAIFLLTVIAGVFLFLRGLLAAKASEAIVRRLRDRLYGHLERLPVDYHDHADTGDLVQRCTSDVETLRVFLSAQIVEIGRSALLLLTAIPILLVLDVRMTVVSLAAFPIILTAAVVFFRKVKKLFLATDEAEGAMTTVLQENLTGIRVVRAFARQDFESKKFADRNQKHRDTNFKLIRVLGTYWALSDVLCLSQIGAVLLMGGYWLQQGSLTVGTLFAFMTYVSMVIWPVRHLGRVLTDTGKATVALGRLKEILAQVEETDLEMASDAGRSALEGGIEFQNVTFGFGSESPVLNDVSFVAAPGSTLALVGPPGSGKSTIVQLILRLYDVAGGAILLDGRPIDGLGRRWVRGQVGTVLQEPFLYSRTVATNVRVGRAAATDEEVIESAQDACVHASVVDFDQGYETIVGERGVTLSGGQRQRLALARALIKDPPILILDDALSAVDTDTEARILSTLRSRRGNRTTVVIAHRLSSVVHADQILVLEDGAVVERGGHGELIARSGAYRRLWDIQGALESEIDVLSEERGDA